MFFHVTIYAKEKTTLQNFLSFLSKINFLISKVFNQRQKKNTNKFVTILKSPHVNKTAQEQFEFKFFANQIVLYSNNNNTSLLCFNLFKQMSKKGFPGLKIKLTYNFDKKKQNKILLSFLNPDNMVLQNKKAEKKIKTYFFMFDSYGEVCLHKNIFMHF